MNAIMICPYKMCRFLQAHISYGEQQQLQEHNKQLLRINIRSADNTVVRLEEHVAETEEIRNRTLLCKGWRVEAGHLGASRIYKKTSHFVMLRTLVVCLPYLFDLLFFILVM